MFFLAIIKSEAFITLISGLIIAIVVFVLYNSSWIIRKKTREEAIQKLKLDSMIEIINGTEKLQLSMTKVRTLMFYMMQDMVKQMREQKYSGTKEIVISARDNFFKDSNEALEGINIFLSLLRKEFALNEEMSREHEMIEEEFFQIANIPKELLKDIQKLEDIKINKNNIIDIEDKFFEKIKRRGNDVSRFALYIISIYKIKLDKEQESLFINFLKIIRFLKIVNYIKFLLRNREDETKLEEILKEMEQKEEPSANEQSEASA